MEPVPNWCDCDVSLGGPRESTSGCVRCEPEDVRVRYHGREYLVVFGPPYFVEQRNGALMGSGMPTVNLADPETGELCHGLTVEVPGAPLRPGQVLVGGGAEGLRVLADAGVVRFTGDYFRSEKHNATFAVCDLLAGRPRDPSGDREDAPSSPAYEWTPADRAELWASIVGDACIHPDDRRAAFAAALRGEPEWYRATALPVEAGPDGRETGPRKK